MNWRKMTVLFLILAFSLTLVSCGGTKKEEAKPPAAEEKKPIKITFWFSLGGKISEATKKLVEQFNASHKDVQVEAIYQGSYDDAINKLKQSIQSKSTPHVMQVYDIGTRFMIDSKAVVPVQKWIDAEKLDVSTFEPNILAYYTVDNKLYSMPFNISTPLLYYNKDMFKGAGLDPEKAPLTFDEVAKAAKALTVKDPSGKVTRPGIAIAIYGWFFEQFMAAQDALYANNGNGRDGTATAVVFNSPQGEAILKWWHGLIKDGVAANLGRKTADTQKAFISGQTAMTIDSTAVLADILKGVDGKFQVGTGFLPRPAGAKGGVVPGGGSLWLLGGHPEAEEKAAWEFIKWMVAPEQQAFWHMNTGYFPVTKLSYNVAALQDHQKKYPQFKVAIDQLRSTPVTRATQGALLGVFTQARQEVEGAIEQVLNNKATPADALKKATDTINGAIERYNQTVTK
ncbi:MAG: ABC transporter substrate-binding protein [Firmicutes bacterium]|nr:ABC transporter substrate-binding protein [Bacillota bacterium]